MRNDGKDLIALSYAFAASVAEGKSADEIAVISQVFMVIGDTLALMASKMSLCENLQTDKSASNSANNSKDSN